MANYANLKAQIDANIYQNDSQAVTGAILNAQLKAMVDALGAGYQFMGVATPTTNPGTPDQNVFYIASEPGTYANFSGIIVGDNEVAILYWNGAWVKDISGAATVMAAKLLGQKIDSQSIEKANMTDINYFNKSEIITGKYITNSGDVDNYAQGIISCPIPIIGGEIYYLKRSASGIPGGLNGVRFLGLDGETKMKPLNGQGQEYETYITTVDAIVEAPQNAYWIQFQVGPQLDFNQLEKGDEFTGYRPFGGKIPFEELPQELSEENVELFVKKDKYSLNLYDLTKDVDGYYITNSGDVGPASGYGISELIEVKPNTKYHLHNEMKSPSVRTIRFVDAAGQKIVPRDGDGNSMSNYSYSGNNVVLWTTEQTKYIQFTTKTPGGHSDNVQLELGIAYTGYKPFELLENINPADLPDSVNDVVEKVYGKNVQIPVSGTVLNKYVDANGQLKTYGTLKTVLFPVVKNGTYMINIPIATNAAGYIMSYMHDVNDTYAQPIAEYGMGDSQAHFYNFVPDRTEYVAVGFDGDIVPTCVLSQESYNSIIAKIKDVNDKPNSILYGKSIMLFGDSLTSASTPGVKGFDEIIAETLQIPCRKFLSDSEDGNKKDNPIWIPNLTNYGKDGTHNAKVSGRPADSILERVKRHVTMDANVDYVLVECSINDYGSQSGEISDSFVGPFDEYLTIPAIEETCRYLTTLGKQLRVGFFIPWKIVYVPDDFFNDYAAVFAKWGIPLLDMRDMAGFNFRGCAAHRELYSLSSASYSNYDNTVVYNLDDKVKYGGVLYKCNADGVVGIPPTNATYWTEITEGSYDGCHLNSLGHSVVAGKILKFIESL